MRGVTVPCAAKHARVDNLLMSGHVPSWAGRLIRSVRRPWEATKPRISVHHARARRNDCCLARGENVMSPKPERPALSPPKPRPHGAPLALAGIRVADFSHFIAGPLCSMILADLGAEVIKIEKADGGDDFRRIRPPVTEDGGAP